MGAVMEKSFLCSSYIRAAACCTAGGMEWQWNSVAGTGCQVTVRRSMNDDLGVTSASALHSWCHASTWQAPLSISS